MRKWYYELAGVVAAIATGVALVWNINIVPQSEPVPSKSQTDNTQTFVVKKDSLYDKWAEGKSLFKSNCASCHNAVADGTGPALQGVTARWVAAGKFKGKSGAQWLNVWVHNWHDAVNSGYPYAVNMANSRAAEMNVFVTLQDKHIEQILAFVENPGSYQRNAP